MLVGKSVDWPGSLLLQSHTAADHESTKAPFARCRAQSLLFMLSCCPGFPRSATRLTDSHSLDRNERKTVEVLRYEALRPETLPHTALLPCECIPGLYRAKGPAGRMSVLHGQIILWFLTRGFGRRRKVSSHVSFASDSLLRQNLLLPQRESV